MSRLFASIRLFFAVLFGRVSLDSCQKLLTAPAETPDTSQKPAPAKQATPTARSRRRRQSHQPKSHLKPPPAPASTLPPSPSHHLEKTQTSPGIRIPQPRHGMLVEGVSVPGGGPGAVAAGLLTRPHPVGGMAVRSRGPSGAAGGQGGNLTVARVPMVLDLDLPAGACALD